MCFKIQVEVLFFLWHMDVQNLILIKPGRRAMCKAGHHMIKWWVVQGTRSPKRRAGKVEIWGQCYGAVAYSLGLAD